MTLYIGLMSGTSMDGIDAALVDVSKNTLLHGITQDYSDGVKKRLNDLLMHSHLSLSSLCQLNTLIGKEFAGAANKLVQEVKLTSKDISAVGSHGQTVCHNTHCAIPYTLQLGCGHTIASLTGMTVVADFRTRDLVHGGQGAPFAPLYHQVLLGTSKEPIALVNVGGIANISVIWEKEGVRGWDIGPGNCLMDAWIAKHQGKPYDVEGRWAEQGELIQPLLEKLLADPFIRLPSPKSFGKEYFSLSWLEGHLDQPYHAVDIQKTLLAFTAYSIAETLLQEQVTKIYLCGGGAHNLALMQMLSELLPTLHVGSVSDLGLSPDYLEAMMFAWLAAQTLHHIPIDLRAITGSHCPSILGAVYY